jgi:hypothetical protein
MNQGVRRRLELYPRSRQTFHWCMKRTVQYASVVLHAVLQIFGWFLEPGKQYELNTEEQPPQQQAGAAVQDAAEQQQQLQHAVPLVKQKKKSKQSQQQQQQRHQQAAAPSLGALVGVKKKRKPDFKAQVLEQEPGQQKQQQLQQHGKHKHKQPDQLLLTAGSRTTHGAVAKQKKQAKL